MRKLLLFIPVLLVLGCQQKVEKSYLEICEEFDVADREMLDLVAEIQEINKDDDKFLNRFNALYVDWVQYRDSQIRALYPEDWKRHYRKEYGVEVFNGCKCKELTRMTENWIVELKMFIEGGPSDQDGCPSIRN